MNIVDDYVTRIEEACGEEKSIIVTFKYNKKDEAIKRILGKARKEQSLSNIILELTFKGVSLRLYVTGKAIFRNLKSKEEAQAILTELLA